MNKEDFLAGLPFKMKNTNELQSVYSYVDALGTQCIQEYTILAPSEPRFHCKVIYVGDTHVVVRGIVLGRLLTVAVEFKDMYRICTV